MEPRIQIGDRVLTNAQAMAVRVAVSTFHIEVVSEESRDALGPIADAYHARLGEVRRTTRMTIHEHPESFEEEKSMAFENDPEGYRMAQGYAGRDFDKPREITINVLCEYGGEDWAANDFLALITKAVESIPADKRGSARASLDGEESTRLVISYVGPEWPQTVADRIRRCEEFVTGHRASERAAYERLKAKFG